MGLNTQKYGVQGALVAAFIPLVAVCFVRWARDGGSLQTKLYRGTLSVLILVSVGFCLYTLARRQWLKYLRMQAIDSAADLISRSQTFDSATSASIALIQEVELVSRGYRLYVSSIPLVKSLLC